MNTIAWLETHGIDTRRARGYAEHEIPLRRAQMVSKLRTPTKTDIDNAERWLFEAIGNLRSNEYYRVKQLCKQVVRALRRKENESA